jgi:uncharacterized protein
MYVELPFPAGRRTLVGVVHLPPLPGSPGWFEGGRPSLDRLVGLAVEDAGALLAAGFDALIVENYGDAPFFGKRVPPETLAVMTRVTRAVIDTADVTPVGVNILRNDARAAIACALATGARFVRVNVHTGAMLTDQGVIEGRAAATMRLRAALGLGPGGGRAVAVLADVHVKHGTPLADEPLERAARDARDRGLADAIVVSGAATGAAPSKEDLARVRAALGGAPLFLGSGLTPTNCGDLVPHLDGAIAASAARLGGRAGAPVEPAAAGALVRAFRAVPPEASIRS